MNQQTIKSNLVSFFSAELTQITPKCQNVTLNHSADILSDRSATLQEPGTDIPQHFPEYSKVSQNEPKVSFSDHLYGEDGRTDLEQFFNLHPNEDQDDIAVNAFLAECKTAKYSHFNQTFSSYSVYEQNLDEIVKQASEKQNIIPQ